MNRSIRRPGRLTKHRISVPASYAGLKDLFDSCQQFADRYAVPDVVRHDMYMAVEELVSNVIQHGTSQPGLRPRITLALTLAAGMLQVTVADNASPFNPLSLPPPDLDTPLLERSIGGLGIHFVRSLMDDVRYRRQGGRNHVRLRKTVAPSPS